MFRFKIIKQSKKSKARLGQIKTSHGVINTPCLVPVATQATIKTLWSQMVEQTKTQVLIANTFHLHLKPGEKIVAQAGGLHKFMNWRKPLMTDSAGYQVFSLGFGRDLQVGKIGRVKNKKEILSHAQPQQIKITDQGVHFKSPVDGRSLFIGPKESIKIQSKLGADIILAFDECTSPNASYTYTQESLERTHAWAMQSLKEKKSKQAIYGIVQGGKFKDLRKKSAKFITSLPFNGYAIGGEFGDDKKNMITMLRWVLDELPKNKPRHLLGIGHLDDIPKIIKAGVDTFDCIVPTHYARRGIAFTLKQKFNLTRSIFLKDRNPIDKQCSCFVCQTYTRSYLAHLFKANEISAMSLVTFHNLYLFNSYIENIRHEINRGNF